jgi:hypothetical protein
VRRFSTIMAPFREDATSITFADLLAAKLTPLPLRPGYGE